MNKYLRISLKAFSGLIGFYLIATWSRWWFQEDVMMERMGISTDTLLGLSQFKSDMGGVRSDHRRSDAHRPMEARNLVLRRTCRARCDRGHPNPGWLSGWIRPCRELCPRVGSRCLPRDARSCPLRSRRPAADHAPRGCGNGGGGKDGASVRWPGGGGSVITIVSDLTSPAAAAAPAPTAAWATQDSFSATSAAAFAVEIRWPARVARKARRRDRRRDAVLTPVPAANTVAGPAQCRASPSSGRQWRHNQRAADVDGSRTPS